MPAFNQPDRIIIRAEYHDGHSEEIVLFPGYTLTDSGVKHEVRSDDLKIGFNTVKRVTRHLISWTEVEFVDQLWAAPKDLSKTQAGTIQKEAPQKKRSTTLPSSSKSSDGLVQKVVTQIRRFFG